MDVQTQPPAQARVIGIDDLLLIAAAPRVGSGFRSPRDTLRIIANRISATLGYDWVTIAVTDHASAGLDAESDLSEPAWAQVVEAGESGLATTVTDLRERPELAGIEQLKSADGSWLAAAFVPIIARGRLVGILSAFHKEPHEHLPGEIETLETAARIAGIALDVAIVAWQQSLAGDGSTAPDALASLNDAVAQLNEAQNTMTQIAGEAGGDAVHAISDLLATKLGRSVLVWELLDGKTRAFSGDPLFRSQMTELLAARDPSRLVRLTEGSVLGTATVHPIGRDRTLGLLLVEGTSDETGFMSSGLIRHAVALIAFDLESERSDRTARNVSRPSILHALVSGRLSARQAHDVGAFVDATGQAMRIGFLRVSDDVVATSTSHRLNFSAKTRGCLAAAAEKNGVLLLVNDADSVKLRSTVSALLESVAPGTWSLGMSEPFVELADAHAALEQAHTALSSADNFQIALHDEMGPTVALLRHMPPGAVPLFVDEMLRPLIDYDREKDGSLVETLSAYLRHRGSLRKAADELFVHSNTVQLRLARASKLTGVDLHDPRQIGILSLAFAWRSQATD